ncbi:MAG: YciI family protein [Streptosporangiales bacterium]|nr:YciI family protein [Streptosporangiales bacterium]
MKFLLLLYGDEAAEEALPVVERRRIIEGHEEFSDKLSDDGVHTYGEALDQSASARTVREDGLVTEGPFAEAREQIGGFYVIECADIERALEYAEQVPQSPGLSVEVRPLLSI